ncbi:MAG: Ig-like domain-containing protein, partial [Planctomycetota bacterium]
TDGDGILDGDEDRDGDGLSDAGEFLVGTNPDIADSNGNGIPDGQEDTDGDGLTDAEETSLGEDGIITNPLRADTDGDGMNDEYETRFGLDPNDASDAERDDDKDGLTNREESELDTNPRDPDRAPPTVESTDPADGDDNVAVNSAFIVRFVEEMLKSSLTPDNILLLQGLGDEPTGDNVVPVDLAISDDGRSVSLRPQGGNLTILEDYAIYVRNVRDDAGNPIAGPFLSRFRTSERSDFDPPFLLTVSPLSGTDLVTPFVRIGGRVNEAIDPGTVDPTTFRVINLQSGQDVVGTRSVDASGELIFFRPTNPLAVGVSHQVRFTSNITDLTGNRLRASTTSFIVGFDLDEDNPEILAIEPGDEDLVPPTTRLSIRLSEAVDTTRVSADNLLLEQGGVPVPVNYQYDEGGRIIRVVPSEPLPTNAFHKLTVGDFFDLAGNRTTTGIQEIDFTTTFDPDTTRPSLLFSSPFANEIGVSLDTESISMRASERLDRTSVTEAGIMLLNVSRNSLPVPARVSLSDAGDLITVSPQSRLDPWAIYQINSVVTDLSGNRDVFPNFRFTTSSLVDISDPSLDFTSPPPASTGIPSNTRVIARLDAPIDLASLPGFQLKLGDDVVPSNVVTSGDQRTIILTPTDPLVVGDYTVELDEIRDRSGNSLSTTSTFSTGSLENLALTNNVVATASSQFSAAWPPTNAIDGDLFTSWFTACGDSANQGQSPFINIELPGDATVGEVRIFGLRSHPNGFDFFSGIVQAFNEAGEEIFSEAVDLPEPNRDLVVSLGNLAGVRSVRFTSTADESCEPGLGEIEIIGEYDDPQLGGFTDTRGISATVTPANGDVDVALDGQIVISLPEYVDQSSAILHSTILFRSEPSFANVPANLAVTHGGGRSTLTITPVSPLLPTTTYRVDVQRTLLDLAGNQATSSFHRFTTVDGAGDTTRPTVLSMDPAPDSDNVPYNRPTHVFFSEAMSSSTLNSNNIVFFVDGVRVNPSVSRSSDNTRVTLTGLSTSHVGKMVSVVATSSVRDISGNPLVDFIGKFTVGPALDGTRSSVVSVQPTNGANNVDPLKPIVVICSEPMDLNSANRAMHVSVDGAEIDGTVESTSGGYGLRFVPAQPIPYGVLVQIVLTTELLDANGVPLRSRFASTYRTIAQPGSVAPSVVDLQPRGSVPANSRVCAWFSEEIAAGTISSDSVIVQNLSAGGSPVLPGTHSLEANGRLYCFVPDADLPAGTRVRFTFTELIRSAAGRTLTRRIFDIFPSDEVDVTDPTIDGFSPFGDSVGAGTNTTIRFAASEELNPLTVNASTVSIRDASGSYLPCTISFASGNTFVSIRPDRPLDPDTLFTIDIDGVTDRAGNAIVGYTTRFETGPGPDTIRPFSVGSSPASSAVGVSTLPVCTVRLSEQIDPPSLTVDSFTLRDNKVGRFLSGTRSVSPDGRTLTFIPDAPLSVGTSHTLRVNTSVLDLAGNPSLSTSVSFTTGFAGDTTGPSVDSTQPKDGDDNVPTNTLLVVHADEVLKGTSLSSATVILEDDGGVLPVTCSLAASGDQVVCTPLMPLLPNTAYTMSIAGLEDYAGNVQAGETVVNFTTGPGVDLYRPNLLWIDPRSNETGVGTEPIVGLEFDEKILHTSVSESTVTLRNDVTGLNVPSTVEIDASGTRIIVTPRVPLAPLTSHRVFANVTDLAGNADSFSSSRFTTGGAGADTNGPMLLAASPTDLSEGVATNSKVVGRFDEPISIFSISSFSLMREGGEAVEGEGTLSADRRVFTFTPTNDLRVGNYLVSFTGLTDTSGNMSTGTLSFQTGGTDNVARAGGTVVTASSEFSATYPAVNAFDGDLFTSWFTACGDSANQGQTPFIEITLPGDATLSELRIYGMRSHPTGFDIFSGIFQVFDVDDNQIFTSGDVALPAPDRDLVVNLGSLPDARKIRFTITDDESCDPGLGEIEVIGEFDDPSLGGFRETTTPSALIDPVNATVDVPLATNPTVTFSRQMDATTLVPHGTVLLRRNGSFDNVPFDMSVNVVNDQTVVTINPLTDLLPSTQYRVDATTAIRDTTGIAIRSAFVVFTTITGAAETTRPTIVSATPADGADDVLLGTPVVLVASEALDASTVGLQSFSFLIDG